MRSSPSRFDLVERGQGVDERDAAAGDDALFDGRARGAEGVLDAVLLLLELDFGGGADLDDGDAAGELAEALLQLLAVPVGGRGLESGLDLADAALDVPSLVPWPSMIVVSSLAMTTRRARPRSSISARVQLAAELVADDRAAGEGGEVAEVVLAAVAEAGRLDARRR